MKQFWVTHDEQVLLEQGSWKKGALPIIVALFALSVALSIVCALRMLHQVGDVTYPESAVTTVALNFARTGELYRSIDRSPYTPVAYGPALYVGLGLFARCFHLDFLGLLFTGRVFSLTSFLLLLATVYFAAVRCGYQGWIAAIPAIFLISDYSFGGWNSTVRPDMAGLLFSSLCIALILVPTRKAVFAAAVCAAIALSFKLTYIAAPASVMIWLIWSRRYFYAACFCLTSVTAILLLAATFMLRGDPMLSQLLIMRHVALSVVGFISLNKEQWRQDSTKFLLAICFTGLWYAVRQNGRRTSQAILFGLYLALAWLIAIVTSLNSGAAENYYLEPRVASALVLPFGICAVGQFWKRIAPVRAFVSAIILLGFVLQPLMWIRLIITAARDQKATAPIARITMGRKILSTDSYLAALSSEPEMLDPYLVTQLEKRGYWSSEPILTRINAQQYDFVVFRTPEGKVTGYNGEPFFDARVTSAIQRNYVPVCATSEHFVLLPSNRRSMMDATDLEQAGCRPDVRTLDKYLETANPSN